MTSSDPPQDSTSQIDVRTEPGMIVLTVRGELDYATAPPLGQTVTECINDQQGGHVVMDLREVEFLGTAAVAVLISVRAHARTANVALRLVVPEAGIVRRALTMMGVAQLFAICSAEAAALG